MNPSIIILFSAVGKEIGAFRVDIGNELIVITIPVIITLLLVELPFFIYTLMPKKVVPILSKVKNDEEKSKII